MDLKAAIEKLKKDWGHRIISAMTYGSSGSSVLFIVDKADRSLLDGIVSNFHDCLKAGAKAPIVMTKKELEDSLDVFPIEYLDMQTARHVLWGPDPLSHAKVETQNLRHQLEFELRSKLLVLRSGYLTLDFFRQQTMMGESLSAFTALFKGILRLSGDVPPSEPKEIWSQLHKKVKIDLTVLQLVNSVRHGENVEKQIRDTLFDRYTELISAVIDYIQSF